MNEKKHSDLKNFTRGGQIILNNLRMWNQIMNQLLFVFGLLFLGMFCLLAWLMTSSAERSATWEYGLAQVGLWGLAPDKVSHLEIQGQVYALSSRDIVHSPYFQDFAARFQTHLLWSAFLATLWSALITAYCARFLRQHGEKHTTSRQIRGDRFVEASELAAQITAAGENSPLVIGGVPLIKEAEIRNFLVHGTVGSGKTVLIRQILDYIRKRGDRAIVYDKGCDFVPTYFREGTDILLNPLDARCAAWDLWTECAKSSDYENLAAALIPMQSGESDPFWVNAARTIFASAAFQMAKDPQRSTMTLLKNLLTSDLETLGHLLKNTEAESLVSEKIEKTAISIKSVLATYLKSLRFLSGLETGERFSIKKWVQRESSSWLFVSSNAEQHPTLRPLISMWLDVATGSLLSLPADLNRRVWLILDEAPSLHKLPYLPETFSEARKFGGCIVIGMQAIAQLKKVYGPNAAEEISGLCNTRFFFRTPSHETAEWVSRELGQAEIDDVRESYSYGSNTMRDGISVGAQRAIRPVISTSEILQQPDLHAYLRLPGEWPITQIQLQYVEALKRTAHFIPRVFNEKALQQVEEMLIGLEKKKWFKSD